MKKFIAGFLSGAIIFSVVGVFAVNSIYDNPYKITVNGAEKYIQGYNIDDYSYFKLRDIADAVGGFSVGFDEQNQTIVLSTNEDVAAPAAPIEPANPATNPANPADTSSSDIDNLPLGTIPEPTIIWIPDTESHMKDNIIPATNDEFQISIIEAYGDHPFIYLDDIADKANEIVGEERYVSLTYELDDTTTWNPIFDFSDSNGNVPLTDYYQKVAPWLRTLAQ